MGFRFPRHPEAFTLDASRKGQGGRQKAADHLAFVRKLPCVICGTHARIEAAHIRYGEPAFGKPTTGIGTKPDDRWTLPLCVDHHREGPDAQHKANERAWWQAHHVDPIGLAMAVYAVSGDEERGIGIIAAMRKTAAKRAKR